MIKCHKCAQPYHSSSQRVGFQIVYEVTYDICLQETEETVKVVQLQGHDMLVGMHTQIHNIL
jgi:hypothetical protein